MSFGLRVLTLFTTVTRYARNKRQTELPRKLTECTVLRKRGMLVVSSVIIIKPANTRAFMTAHQRQHALIDCSVKCKHFQM